jgi:hypothetical protein
VGDFSKKSNVHFKLKAMARFTADDYQKQLKDLQKQQTALENRIRARAIELCRKNPDLATVNETDVLSTGTYLAIIKAIETELAKKHPHKQTAIEFPERAECTSKKSPDGKHHYQDGSKYCYYCGLNKNYF